ncbi:hypothetical protein [Sulfurimicrobium lacus]|uniref:hypothetical protein n=1 Tax=Sulfurimicrobium lacus TaxID=2715678 RepID=UPI00156555EF|nr:hypothetical protein [Sulfurimicrobium lacus]
MIYMIFVGMLLAVVLPMPAALGSIFFTAVTAITISTTMTTKLVCAFASRPASIAESIKVSVSSLIAMGLVVVFSFQVLARSSPTLFVVFPIFALAAGVLAIKTVLQARLPLSLIIGLLNAAVCYLVLNTIAATAVAWFLR